jgi:hypothetical protein
MFSTCANAWRNRDLLFSGRGDETRDRASRKCTSAKEGAPVSETPWRHWNGLLAGGCPVWFFGRGAKVAKPESARWVKSTTAWLKSTAVS